MKAATDTPAARVSAARVVLEMALKQREATETRAIIERLEQQLAEAKAAGLLKGGGCPT